MQQVILPQIEALAKSAGDQDIFLIGDVTQYANYAQPTIDRNGTRFHRADSWVNHQDGQDSLRYMRGGDQRMVPASDAFLSQFEEINPPGPKFLVQDSVAGGCVNVGAFLAGSPMHMRLRTRNNIPTSPLCIVADMTSSCGIDATQLIKRGTAILALVRNLSSIRPVELYVSGNACSGYRGGQGGARTAGHVLVRIDAAPLDLSRACHMLTAPSVPRIINHEVFWNLHTDLNNARGAWCYNDETTFRKHAKDVYHRVLSHAETMIFLAPPHMNDEAITDPVRWVKDMLVKYGSNPE
jgi:hypothetical protein